MSPNTIQIHIGSAQTRLSVMKTDVPTQEHVLPIGWQMLFMQRDGLGVPTPLAIEQAIQVVEDALESVQRELPQGAHYIIDSTSLAHLGEAASVMPQIDLDMAETWYQALVARAVGAPSARGSGFADPAGDAIVLILREAMHHLKFSAIHVINK